MSGEMSKETETMSTKKIAPTHLFRWRAMLIGALVALGAWLALAAPASAAAPAWKLTVATNPTNFIPGSAPSGFIFRFIRFPQYSVLATNVGTAPTSGPATITDTLPTGVTPVETYWTSAFKNPAGAIVEVNEENACDITGQTVTCEGIEAVGQGGTVHLAIAVEVAEEGVAPPSVTNEASISGGGAAEAVAQTTTTISNEIAPFDFTTGSAAFSLAATGPDGSPVTQAGSHPDQLTVDLGFPTQIDGGTENAAPAGRPRDVHVDLPRGMVVNPEATVLCREIELQTEKCPDAATVGTLTVQAVFGYGPAPGGFPLYNMVPPGGKAAELGAVIIGGIFVHIIGGVNSAGEFELGAESNDILASGNPVIGVQTVLWGDPSDASHDGLRGRCNSGFGSLCPIERTNTPLLTMPSSCRPALTATATANSWEDPSTEIVRNASVEDPGTELPTATEGCNQLELKPSFEAKPSTNLADSPTGMDVNLHVPQTNDFEELATANFKDIRVTFPKGMAVNPSSANGQEACSSSQIGLATQIGESHAHFNEEPANCPDAAKLGSVEVLTPLLDHPMHGALYLAKPFDNPFDSLIAVYIDIEDPPTGVVAKLAGRVDLDPQTGQITSTFNDNPELPIEDVKVSLFKGPRASLITPPTCATHTTTADITPWSTPEGSDVHTGDSFATALSASGSGDCPSSEAGAPNKPSFDAGTIAPQAAAYSPFVLKLSREDGTQRLGGFETTLPKGLIGKLAGISYCSEAQIAQAKARSHPNEGQVERQSPSCPAASELGSVTAAAGAGIAPFYASGKAYLAGPYKGAPLSVVTITPAIAGPFDLGAIVVRASLYVDPQTAQVRAVSDPLPRILEGIPLDIRSIAVKLDRPEFTLNPTSCDPMAITGSAVSTLGGGAALNSPFQVGGCSSLGFKPKLAFRLKGPTKRGGHPALSATYKPRPGDANLKSLIVRLPRSAFLDQAHIRTICTRVQFAADACPKGAQYGYIKAWTPLLDEPLQGPVWLRSSNHKLPDLIFDLQGTVDVEVASRIDSVKGGIRASIESAPDAPLSKVLLSMQGAKKGLIINSRNLCGANSKANVDFGGQNGKEASASPVMRADCGKGGKRRR